MKITSNPGSHPRVIARGRIGLNRSRAIAGRGLISPNHSRAIA